MNAAKYRDILDENFFQSALDLRLGQRFTFQQDNDPKHTAKITKGSGSSAKQTTWEGGHRVPALVYWPGHIPPNCTSSALLSTLDIFPTLVTLAHGVLPANRRFDGKDVSEILVGATQDTQRIMYHPNSGAAGRIGDVEAVRLGHYKAFYTTGCPFSTVVVLLLQATHSPRSSSSRPPTLHGRPPPPPCRPLSTVVVLLLHAALSPLPPLDYPACSLSTVVVLLLLLQAAHCALACDGSIGHLRIHDPPLLFNLNRDPQEMTPVPQGSEEYEQLLPLISQAMAALHDDVRTDNVSTADYFQDPSVAPCCSPALAACRCKEPADDCNH
ncbi:unnamed protein product [Ranitomeya imitator]|uniref:Sulfatase N-terminal domain-containing protein n=1 Tax=Ranitomeya imitator TaxID=111125 RepID=A0ABN9M6F9_9NEOB|nr:unnamed protein product [Ranitomeya imitator]